MAAALSMSPRRCARLASSRSTWADSSIAVGFFVGESIAPKRQFGQVGVSCEGQPRRGTFRPRTRRNTSGNAATPIDMATPRSAPTNSNSRSCRVTRSCGDVLLQVYTYDYGTGSSRPPDAPRRGRSDRLAARRLRVAERTRPPPPTKIFRLLRRLPRGAAAAPPPTAARPR